ncbi:MAG: TerB family tellurite resistance protein [Oligoflexia bacterium]|nr:TerB family tellurite resistance protein [Oligoflexia bacterium]
MNEYLAKAKISLEDSFFIQEDKILIEKLRQMEKMKLTIEGYANVTGIANPTVLKKFYELEIPLEVAASLKAIPLIEVAWADGIVDEEEMKVILDKAEKLGIKKDSIEFELIERWMQHRPSEKMIEAWIAYVQGICEELSKGEQLELKNELLKYSLEIARASGGIKALGINIGNRISKQEKVILNKLERAFPI